MDSVFGGGRGGGGNDILDYSLLVFFLLTYQKETPTSVWVEAIQYSGMGNGNGNGMMGGVMGFHFETG